MKEDVTEMRKEAQDAATQLETGRLVEAAKWVYRRYGNDLSSFFRDAYEAEARKRQKRTVDQARNGEACL